MGAEAFCIALVSPRTDASIAAYDLVLGLPAFAFLLFLGWRLRPSLRKLQRSQSQIMASYYGFLWVVALLNGLRCIVQMLEGFSGEHLVVWNVLWMLTRFGLVVLEVSVVVFLLQGYLTSGSEALVRTLVISGVYAVLELLIEMLLVFGYRVPLFFYGGKSEDDPTEDMRWDKWSFWLAHSLLFLTVYAGLLVLPFTMWRDRLPAKQSFYRYVLILFGINAVACLGAILLGSGVVGGYCIYGVNNFLYYALYPPLLYMTFLAEFFQDNDDGLDLLMYSEMKDAGVFESYEDDF